MSKKKTQAKPKQKPNKQTNTTQKSSISINYDKNMNKADEFKVRVLERVVVRILGVLEEKRP